MRAGQSALEELAVSAATEQQTALRVATSIPTGAVSCAKSTLPSGFLTATDQDASLGHKPAPRIPRLRLLGTTWSSASVA